VGLAARIIKLEDVIPDPIKARLKKGVGKQKKSLASRFGCRLRRCLYADPSAVKAQREKRQRQMAGSLTRILHQKAAIG
jgi:hypothetical protein